MFFFHWPEDGTQSLTEGEKLFIQRALAPHEPPSYNSGEFPMVNLNALMAGAFTLLTAIATYAVVTGVSGVLLAILIVATNISAYLAGKKSI